MGWEDRPYYRDGRSGTFNPLTWIMSGSVPLFTLFEIRVRAHASLVISIGLVLLFGLGYGFTWQDRLESMGVLFVIVLLHEFGHCFAARWVGGEAHDILMTPLGGLAMARPPRRPLATFITVAAGPMVNVLICLATTAAMMSLRGRLVNPFAFDGFQGEHGLADWYPYLVWVYLVSWTLLLFNLLPIYPLDGGQMLHAILWPWVGRYKATLFSCITGMIGAVILFGVGIASFRLLLMLIAVMGFMTCYQMRLQTLADGPYSDVDELDYGLSLYDAPSRRRKLNRRVVRKAQKAERQERIEQRKIDAILAKVSANGMHTLTWWEKRTLKQATERQRRAEGSGRAGRKTRV